MRHRSGILTLLCARLLSSAFCLSGPAAGSPNAQQNTSKDQPQAQAQPRAPKAKALDVCSLLTGSDIAAVLGEPLQGLKPTVQATRNMNMSQCLFVTRDFAKSASLVVATANSGDFGGRRLRAFWRNQFHSPRKQEEETRPASRKSPAKSAFIESREAPKSKAATPSKSASEADEDARTPRPISALGEEAYWVGSPISGALYVLQGDVFLRISVGGIPEESARIAKSKSLATAVLPRLRHNPR
jgi:hypothetical protein